MQTLAVDIATTFVDDAAALASGFGHTLIRFVMAPIDRIANACDIAGVLAERRASSSESRTRSSRLAYRQVPCAGKKMFSYRFF